MAIYRVTKQKNYTIIGNPLHRSKDLSIKAKWTLETCLSMPDDWVFNVKGLAHFCAEGPDTIRSAVLELEEKGYIVRRRDRKDNGKLGSMIYDIYEDPKHNPNFTETAQPALDFPTQASPEKAVPAMANAPLHNTNHKKKNRLITDHTYPQSTNQELTLEAQIRRQIEYDIMRERYDSRLLDDVVAVMTNAMTEQSDIIPLSRSKALPTSYVQDRLAQVKALHIEQVMDALDDFSPAIHNPTGYLLTALINAANTMSTSYQYGA